MSRPTKRTVGTPRRHTRPIKTSSRKELWHALFEQSLDAFLIADNAGCLVDANPVTSDLLGYSREELLHRSIFDLTLPSDTIHAREMWRHFIAQGKQRGEYQLVTDAGRLVEVAYHAAAHIVPGRHLVILHDQTSEKRTARLHTAIYRISEAAHTAPDLAELYHQAHDIVGTLMPARNLYIALYDAATNLLAFPYYADEYDAAWAPHPLGNGLTSYVIRTGKPLLATPAVYAELIRTGNIEMVGTPAVDWLGVPLQTQNGVTIGVLAVQTYTPTVRLTNEHKDLLVYVSTQIATAIERKRAENALRQAEEQFRAVVQNMPILLSATDEQQQYVFWNRACEQTTGYSAEQILGNPHALELLYPDATFRAQVLAEWQNRFGNFENWEIELTCRDGTLRTIAWSNISARAPILGWASWGIGVDVTERNRAASQIRTALREKEILLREIHHRVKNNLNVVSGLLELQANLAADPSAQRAFAESQKRIRAMALLHETLYKSSDLARVDLSEYIHNLMDYLQTAYHLNQSVQVAVQADKVTLSLDTAITCGLLVNELVTNAFKYAFPRGAALPHAPKITVTLALHDDRVTLCVGDNGVGLPPDLDWRNSATLGLQLVAMFTQTIAGDLTLQQTLGSEWVITFPLPLVPVKL